MIFKILLLTVPMLAFAENTSNTKVELPKTKKSDEADQLITNRMLRASTGSLSNWSINSAFSYSGGSLSNPLDAERPNLNAAGDIPAIQGITGDVSISYRLSTKDRLNLGIGLQMLAPFHSSIETNSPKIQSQFDQNQGELDLNNPTLTYSRIGNINGMQSVLSISATRYTVGNLTDDGFNSKVSAAWNTMYEFKKTGFSAGVYFLVGRFINDDDVSASSRNRQLHSEYAILPQFEYVINDTFNLRTISRAWWYQSDEVSRDFRKLAFTQSVGLGISVTRDLFLYPNIQFKPNDMRADATNIGINANINMF